ncbi:hypothetical protein KI387_017463 [Taxus chinensis]|uniref:U-box domain-containing protein n=1 Tax=Taxus chinensis TaxID=29808 RepID=A0AA38GFV8_TAXCH|nr:hypothetical protein KI387_017463 [Taxus chinensis]
MAADSGFSDLSPMALLKALLDLGNEICACAKPKAFQKRNSNAITRRIKVLCLLFEEIRDNPAIIALPPSALLCLRGMHIMFQRMKRAMEEWNSASSVWLLMQTEAMSMQFHQLTQDMATALDVLPLKLVDVTDEVRDLIKLVHYCKCVLFGVAEECYDKDEQKGVGFSEASSTENIQVPDDFKCPISLDLMCDPAIVATGLTYDRVSITR